MNSISPAENFNPKAELIGSDAFRIVKVGLSPGQQIIVESGAMASQDVGISCDTRMNGGLLSALIFKFLGKESFFINYYKNETNKDQTIILTQSTPGEIVQHFLTDGESIFIERGSFIARTAGVTAKTVWAGFASLFAGEGLFKLKFSGVGYLYYGSFGAIVEKEVNGDLIVDSGHLLSYPPTIKLSLRLSSGLFSSFASKEGLVLRLSGSGKVLLQTRSVNGLAQWLNARFWG